jgi:hypothetical protein
LRKLQEVEFCSDEHKLAFQQQQSDLALARLLESQRRIDRPAAHLTQDAAPAPVVVADAAEPSPGEKAAPFAGYLPVVSAPRNPKHRPRGTPVPALAPGGYSLPAHDATWRRATMWRLLPVALAALSMAARARKIAARRLRGRVLVFVPRSAALKRVFALKSCSQLGLELPVACRPAGTESGATGCASAIVCPELAWPRLAASLAAPPTATLMQRGAPDPVRGAGLERTATPASLGAGPALVLPADPNRPGGWPPAPVYTSGHEPARVDRLARLALARCLAAPAAQLRQIPVHGVARSARVIAWPVRIAAPQHFQLATSNRLAALHWRLLRPSAGLGSWPSRAIPAVAPARYPCLIPLSAAFHLPSTVAIALPAGAALSNPGCSNRCAPLRTSVVAMAPSRVALLPSTSVRPGADDLPPLQVQAGLPAPAPAPAARPVWAGLETCVGRAEISSACVIPWFVPARPLGSPSIAGAACLAAISAPAPATVTRPAPSGQPQPAASLAHLQLPRNSGAAPDRSDLHPQPEMAPVEEPLPRWRRPEPRQWKAPAVASRSGPVVTQPSGLCPDQKPSGLSSPPLFERLLPLLPVRSKPLPSVPVSAAAQPFWPAAGAITVFPKSGLRTDQPDGSGPRRLDPVPTGRGWQLPVLPGAFRFWRLAPADLKWISVGLPLVLLLVLYSALPSGSRPPSERAAAGAPSTSDGVRTSVASRWAGIQSTIMRRAAINLADDFRSGLGAWDGSGDWAKSWTYDQAGFVLPGAVALYSPSLLMADYSLEFLGQIERRSLNWVIRARDTRNYYAMRLVLSNSSPMPKASIVRYAVIDGKEGPVTTLPLPMPLNPDSILRIRVEVKGKTFTTWLQGQVIDSFSDDRLARGGVGFFAPKGEKSRLRWVEVSHQYDFLGRLCALLAPYSVQAQGRDAE